MKDNSQDFCTEVIRQENEYDRQIEAVVDSVCTDSNIDFILIAGPSCSGKTTTTRRLAEMLTERGRPTRMISIDDFFFTPDPSEFEMDGDTDFESLDSVDLELFHSCINDLAQGRATSMPVYNFVDKKREERLVAVEREENDIFIIEGLHALNPVMYEGATKPDQLFKIYLHAVPPNGDGVAARLLRRLVRDYQFRAASPELTLYLWHSVVRGEMNNIRPFASLADVTINTYFEYEPSVLKFYVERVLSELSPDSEYFNEGQAILNSITDVEIMSDACVPQGSILREFIG